MYTKEVVINDLTPPSAPVIETKADYGYPLITSTGIILQDGLIDITCTEEDDNIETYYSFDNTNWNIYNEQIRCIETGTIYAKNVKKSNGLESTIVSKNIRVPGDAVPWACCTPNGGHVSANYGATKNFYMNVDNSAIGKNFSIIYSTTRGLWYNYVQVMFYNSEGTMIYDSGCFLGNYYHKTTRTFNISENTTRICIRLYGRDSDDSGDLYRVYLNN